MYLVVVVMFACGALLLGLAPLPRWVSLVPGLAVGIFYFVAWLHEQDPSLGGDPQPDLIAAVGVVFTAVVLGAGMLGWRFRRR